MAAPACEEVGGGGPAQPGGPPPALLSWPLAGCRPDSLGDLFSAGTLAELARVAGAGGGAVALDLCGHTLQAAAGGKPGALHLLETRVPPAGLRSLALRNGTLALRPGVGLAFDSKQPLSVTLERVKLTRPAPTSGSASSASAGARVQRAPETPARSTAMVAFTNAVLGRMVQCRVELSPAGPGDASAVAQASTGVGRDGARRAAPYCDARGPAAAAPGSLKGAQQRSGSDF